MTIDKVRDRDTVYMRGNRPYCRVSLEGSTFVVRAVWAGGLPELRFSRPGAVQLVTILTRLLKAQPVVERPAPEPLPEPDPRDTLEAALMEFKRATAGLLDVWSDASADAIEDYPQSLPSFDEFEFEVQGMRVR